MNGTSEDFKLANMGSPFHMVEGVDIAKIIRLALHYKWQIIIVSILVAFITFIHMLHVVPSFRTSALILIKQENSSSKLLHLMNENNDNSETYVALIRSRYILEPVIQKNNLNLFVTRADSDSSIINKWWRGASTKSKENIQFTQFHPTEDLPQNFSIVIGKLNSYQLFSDKGELLITGQAGKNYNIDKQLEVSISSIDAKPGSTFNIHYEPSSSYVQRLSHSLSITSLLGNDPSMPTGVYQVQLVSQNKAQSVDILNQIVNTAIQKNMEQKRIYAQNTLDFLNQRLPTLKKNLEEDENYLNEYHIKNRTPNMGATGYILLQQLTASKQAISQLASQKQALLQVYTPAHPLVIAVEEKEKELYRQKQAIEKELMKFPLLNQEEINLTRESKIKNLMYTQLLNNKQQYEIATSSTTPDIILLSNASYPEELPKHKILMTLASFLISIILAMLAITIKTIFNKTIENPMHLENALKIPVQVVIPFSKKQKQLEKMSIISGNLDKSSPLMLAKHCPDDIAIESLRSLHASLQILCSLNNRVIVTMGSVEGIGKSFVSLNLAQVLADAGKRTLLIDADIRKGGLNQVFHQPKSPGLSEYLENKIPYQKIVHTIHDKLSFISCGTNTTHPLVLFQGSHFADFIKLVREEFDHVIIDTPPLIPVTDSILIAKYADVKLFVVSAFKETLADVKQSIKKSHAHGVDINGFVFNHRTQLSRYDQYRYTYHTA